MQLTGFNRLKILSINPSEEWLNKIDEEFEEYIFEENGIKCIRIDVFFQDNKENIFKYSFTIKDKEKISKSGALKYINCTGDIQWCNSETQLWDSFKQWEKVLSWQKNGIPVTKWESGSVPLEKEILAKKAFKIALEGEDNLINLWKAIHPFDKNDTSVNLLLNIDNVLNGELLTIPDADFHVTAFLYVSNKEEQKIHNIFFPLDFMRDVNNNMSISNYNKNAYKEFVNSLDYIDGNYILSKCQEFKKDFIKIKQITEDEGDY
jgi:hypothetical protein